MVATVGATVGATTVTDFTSYGVVLSVLSTFCGVFGKDCFRLAFLSGRKEFYFVGVLFAVVLDPVLNTAALAYATQLVVAGLGGFVIVWNVMIAPLLLNDRLTRIRALAAVLVCIGMVFAGVGGPRRELVRTPVQWGQLLGRPTAIVYFCLLSLWSLIATWRWRRDPDDRGRLWGVVLAGSLSGNLFAVKAVTQILRCSGLPPAVCTREIWQTAPIYVFSLLAVLAAAVGLIVLALALRHSEALDAITVFTGVQMLCSIISATMVLDEGALIAPWQWPLYLVAIFIVLLGIGLLAVREMRYPCVVPDAELHWPHELAAHCRRHCGGSGCCECCWTCWPVVERPPASPLRVPTKRVTEASKLLEEPLATKQQQQQQEEEDQQLQPQQPEK